MKFIRVNKDTVNCIIQRMIWTNRESDWKIFLNEKRKQWIFCMKVVERATQEVDYKPSGSYTPMQISILPDHTISLTLSENARKVHLKKSCAI